MKHLKFFLTILFVMTSVVTMAMDYPDLVLEHRRTANEPYQQFSLRLNALYGIDNYLTEHKFYLGQRSGYDILGASSFEYAGFNNRRDDDFTGSYGMNDIIFEDEHYVVVLTKIEGFDNQTATVMVYKREDPLEDFSVKFECSWKSNNASESWYTKYLDFYATADEKKKLKEMQLIQKESRVYFVSPETMVIDAHFGTSTKERYFDVSGQPQDAAKNTFNGKSPKQPSGKYAVKVNKNVGLYAISHPYKVSLTEHMSLHEYCTQTFPSKMFTSKIYAQPADLNCAPDQYAKSVTLTWKMADPKIYDSEDAAYAGKWYVYRRRKGEGDSSWTLLKSVSIKDADDVFKYEDKDAQQLEFNTPYEYNVCFYPNYWLESRGHGGTVDPEKQAPMAEFSKTAETQIATISPLIGNPEAEPLEDRIKVTWNHHYVPKRTFDGTFPTFTIQYQKTNSSEWVELAKLKISDLEQESKVDGSLTETYVHSEGIEASCIGYKYRIVFDRGDNVSPFMSTSTVSPTRISSGTTVTSLVTSKGIDKNGCNLTWKAHQVSSTPTTFRVSRREVRETEFYTIYTVQGTGSTYSYYDQGCEPGIYYEYRVEAFTDCEGQLTCNNYKLAIGFAQNYGTISGQVLYGSGDAVDSVRVTLTPNSSTEDAHPFFYATQFTDQSYGIQVPFDDENGLRENALEGDFTIGMWMKTNSERCHLFNIVAENGWDVKLFKDNNGLTYLLHDTFTITKLKKQPKANSWNYVFLKCKRRGTEGDFYGDYTLGFIDEEGKLYENTVVSGPVTKSKPKVMVVGMQKVDESLGIKDPYNYMTPDSTLLIDEFRVYSRALSDNEILRSYDRMLSGDEQGLSLYWSMNEGYQTGYVYDRSRTNSVPNKSHGKVVSGVAYTEDSPNQTDQVSTYGLTDENGSYVITGIPYSGNGINYTITPSKGVHEFNSSKQTRYISNHSLVYSGVNFTDVSYFPVHGTVRYAGTTIPVDSCTFEVDGTPCTSEGTPIMTDAEGKFTISVPIGDHYITIKRNNHVFVDKGRYPANGKHTFKAETYNLDFEDATLVNFAGRIVGGYKDQNKPLGFEQSMNNIGRVTMTLTPTDDRYYVNAKKTIDGTTFTYDFNDERVDVACNSNNNIESHSYRGFGSVEECKKIYIETDAETGEFSAMLPPINYQMSAQKLVANSDIVVGESRTIDLSKFHLASADTLFSETKTTDPATGKVTVTKKAENVYEYQKKYIADYHTTPVFKVNDGEPFGEKKYKGRDEDGVYEVDGLYTKNGNTISYKLGYPVFVTENDYDFEIEAYESYINADDPKAEEDNQPLSGCFVQISNALSSSTSMVMVPQTLPDGTKFEEGTPVGEEINGVQLDSLGQATYEWVAGLPNTNAKTDHALSITMKLFVSGKQYDWVPDDNSGIQWRADGTNTGPGMKGVNVGAINMGNNFVTLAADQVMMVLRDPPGAKSSATWKKGSTLTVKNSRLDGHGAHTKDVVAKAWGKGHQQVNLASGVIEVANYKHTFHGGLDVTGGKYWEDINTETFTTTQDISTSSGTEYVGSWGDLYVGKSRNRIFGDARQVYIPRSASKIDVRNVTGVQDSVKTIFIYSQLEILRNIIPNYKAQIKKLLKDTYGQPRKSRSEITTVHYYSNLPEDHPNYGRSNFDPVFGSAAGVNDNKEGPSYAFVAPEGKNSQDTIQFMFEQIKAWENIIKRNEQEKVMMYEDRNSSDVASENISFDGGASVTRSYTSSTDSTSVTKWDCEEHVIVEWNSGTIWNGAGVIFETANNTIHKQAENETTSNQVTQTFSFTLGDNPYCDHSVDVYSKKSEDQKKQFATTYYGWGPIFRTRAGHTYGPYEDGDSTLYFSKGEEIMAKTIQMEVPQLIINEPVQSNVPNGGSAFFKVKLSNQSYAQSDHYFRLGFKPDTNPKGAVLTVDGMPLLEGLKLYLPYNKTIEKTIELKQGDGGTLDYNDIKLYLRSTTQDDATSHWPVIESVVPISAHFVPVSTDVALHIDHQVVNTATGTTVNFQVSDFDINHTGLKALRLQYRYNKNDWAILKEWVTGEPLPGQESLADAVQAGGGILKAPFDMKQYVDGNYTFRVLSATSHGNEEEVTKTSEEIEVIKDTHRPTLIVLPMPSDGVLDRASIISAEFNEDIIGDKVTQDNNIEVKGTLIENSKNVYQVGLIGQNIAENQSMTKNKIDLRNQSFTAEFWAKNANGYLLTFGTNETLTALGVNGKLPYMVIANGGAVDEQGKAVEPFEIAASESLTFKDDEWVFWQLSYKAKDPQVETSKNTLSLTAYYGDQTKKVFNETAVPDILSNGKMTVGSLSTTEFADLALWNYVRGEGQVQQGMKRKSGLESGLWHYWKMEEGHGETAEDVVGGNHIEVPANGWFIDNVNYSAHLTADKHLAIPMNDINMDDADSYALEFWYKRDTQLTEKTDQQILNTSNNGITMSAKANGHIALKTVMNDEERTYESVGAFDDEWHHVLLNVQRGISAMVYVDGTSQMALQEKTIPGLACDSLYFGDGLTGDVDEVRIWSGLYSNQVLTDERYNMIDTASVKGLVRYYPFESSSLDEGNQVVTSFSPHNAIEKSDVTIHDLKGRLVKASTMPPLKVAPTRSNLFYTFTASDRKITITIDEGVLNKLEGTTINISLKNVPDINGNSSKRISWNAYVRKNPLRWGELQKIDITTEEGTEKTFTRDIVNLSAANVNWTLNMPSWLSASPSSGTINPNSTVAIEFTVSADVPVGKLSENIGLTNVANNMTERCAIDLTVLGNTPGWSVDKSDKEFSIPMTARLVVNNAYSEDESDMVAAFIEDVCVGVSNVQYNSRRNSFFVNMTLYGGQDQLGKSITFKAWDANHNVTYSPLERKNGGKMIFTANATPFGSYDKPEVLVAGSMVEQTLDLKEGWNWVSFYVNSKGQSLNDALRFADGKISTVKTQIHGAEWNPNLDDSGVPYGFMGRDLEDLNENSMYAIKALEDVSVTISGTLLTGAEAMQTVKKGWTWIRNPYFKNQSVTSAFSGFTPTGDDVLQTRDAYAQWTETYHRWEGLMTNFMPGTGYKYYSGSSESKPLFDDITLQNTLRARRVGDDGEQSSGDNYGYADNMLVIAKLVLTDAVDVDMDQVAVTATNNSQETFTTLPDRGFYVMTVAGEDNATFTFDALVNGTHRQLYAFVYTDDGQQEDCSITFVPDAVTGSFTSPIILTDNKDLTDIKKLDTDLNGDYEVYTIQGYLLFKGKNNAEQFKKLAPGVYIVNGSKYVKKSN